MKNAVLFLVPLLWVGCAQYKMGNTPKGTGLANIRVLYVPTVQNETDETSVPGPVTNAILQELDRDGTYRHGRKDECDAILEVTVKKIERSPIRQSTAQFLTTLQFQLVLTLEYRLYDVKEKKEIFPKSTMTGSTTFFVQGDQTESQRQALPLAAQNAAQNLVNALANRGW
ncbi:MAG: hypothetical protein EBT57_02935 [Verrucomicrobia bacterium]|nr:hypothetical protein [Verrucomicrobiota bacterium]